MKTTKNHVTPLFEVVRNEEANKKFFVASGVVEDTPTGGWTGSTEDVKSGTFTW